MTVRKVVYKGWKNCCRISNGKIELIVTTDVGPRVIRFGFVGGPNLFKEYAAQLGLRGGKKWRIYGGHRLWHAPEAEPRTYFPDNFPVTMQKRGSVVRFIQPVETTTGIAKEIDVKLVGGNCVELVHRLRNAGHWPVELAPWALSVMAPGGTAIIPLPKRGSHPEDLLPGNLLTVWLYTDMTDPRWAWGRKYILLRQDPSPTVKPQKLGALVPDGWAAYALDDQLFVKKFACVSGADYADFGCNFETFTNNEMLELESLGPFIKLEPGQSVEHRETWLLFSSVASPKNDRDVDRHVWTKVRRTK
jgi:hypothetical protein